MDFKLAKELKDAGFPQELQEGGLRYWDDAPDSIEPEPYISELHRKPTDGYYKVPTLSELIEATRKVNGSYIFSLQEQIDRTKWCASVHCQESPDDNPKYIAELGSTPEEAVVRLWLALKESKS